MSQRLPHTLLRRLAAWQVIPVGMLCPILILADRFPPLVVSLALLAIPILWTLHRLARGRFFTSTAVDLALLMLIGTLPVGWWAAALPDLAVPHLVKYLAAVAFFYSLVNTFAPSEGEGKERGDRLVAWASIGVLGVTAVLAGVSLVGIAWSGSKYLPAGLTQRIPRLISVFWNPAGFHPNIVGGFLAMSVPVTAAFAWAARTWPRRLLLGCLLLFELLVLLLTQSRGAMLGIVAALMVVAVARDRRWAWGAALIVVVVAVVVAIVGVQPALDLVMGGLGGSTVQSAAGRLELFSRAIYMLEDFPFTGVGLGMFSRVLNVLYPLFLVGPETELPHAHNIFLQAGVDHGMPGLIAYLALIILLGVMGIQTIRQSRGRPWEPLAIGLLAGLVAFLIHGQVDTYGYTPRAHILVWGHFGLLAAVWNWARNRPAVKEV